LTGAKERLATEVFGPLERSMTDQRRSEKAHAFETLIREYFDACNAADVDRIRSCFVDDAVHYFPPGTYGGPFRGAGVIAEKWKAAVENIGPYWTVDQVIVDPETDRAVIEWTHFKTKLGIVSRGDEWYVFDPASGRIREIRAYYASPSDPQLSRLEFGSFDYEARGYPVAARGRATRPS
jgi:hypothetical protein